MLETALQAIAVVVTAISWIPQTYRLLQGKQHEGVSLSSWALGGGTALLFCLYGISLHAWALAFSEGAFALGALSIVWLLKGLGPTLLCAAIALLVALVGIPWCPPVVFGVAGIIGVLGMRSLQVRTTLHTKTLSGMSVWSWILLTINVLAWGLYGLLAGLWPLVVTSIVGVLNSLLLLWIVARTRRRALRTESA